MKVDLIPDNSLFEECDFSGLPKASCAHCLKHDDSFLDGTDASTDEAFVIVAVFATQWAQSCTIDRSHRIKRGDMVGKVKRTDNPFIVVPGVACESCVRDYPREKQV